MQWIDHINLFAASILNLLFYIIILKKLYKTNVIKNQRKIILNFILFGLSITLINIFNKSIFKVVITFPVTVVVIRNLLDIDINKSTTYTIITTIFGFFGEIFVSILFAILPFNYSFIYNNVLGTLIGCILTIIMTYPIILIKPVRKELTNLSDFLTKSTLNLKLSIIIVLLIIGAFTYKIIIGTSDIISNIMNLIIIIIVTFIIYKFFKEYQKSTLLSEKYNMLINYLEKYEKEINNKGKIIHDYKNQLIVIYGYAENNTKLKKYISTLIEEQKNISENNLIQDIDKLPKGLKGLIYYKISQIDKEIKINLSIKNNLSAYNKISIKTNKDILKIIGIILDNAIEAVEKENENKFIDIDISYIKKEFIIKITNNCTKKINIDNIYNTGYSTKGKNRGYGLPIVNDIIKKEKNMIFNVFNEDNIFTALLKIKI